MKIITAKVTAFTIHLPYLLNTRLLFLKKIGNCLTESTIKYSIGFMTHNFECFLHWKSCENYNYQNYSKGRCLLFISWKLTILATSTALQFILLLILSPSSFNLPKQFWTRKIIKYLLFDTAAYSVKSTFSHLNFHNLKKINWYPLSFANCSKSPERRQV